MKIRNGFVSNSSSSSFIIRKDVLNKRQLTKLTKFFNYYNNNFETKVEEDSHYFKGYLESHNVVFDDEKDIKDNIPINQLISMMGSFNIPLDIKYFFSTNCEHTYGEYPSLEDIPKKE